MTAIPADVREWRKSQRAVLIARRNALPAAQHHDFDRLITGHLLAGFPLLRGMTIGFYWPFNSEFDPRFAIRQWRNQGAIAALPEVVEKASPLRFRTWWPAAPMTKGVYDLPVPDGTSIVVPQALLIPPVGFDESGYRLGYGGGYFDRTLAAMQPQPLKLGVAYECSRMPTIRPQPFDVPMDFIVTEAGIHVVATNGLERIDDPARAAERAGDLVSLRAIECAARTESG